MTWPFSSYFWQSSSEHSSSYQSRSTCSCEAFPSHRASSASMKNARTFGISSLPSSAPLRKRALIGIIISDAKQLGELCYRQRMVQDQLKGLTIRVRSESKWKLLSRLADTSEPSVRAVVREQWRNVRQHIQYLSQTRRSCEQGLRDIQDLITKVQAELDDSIGLLEKS